MAVQWTGVVARHLMLWDRSVRKIAEDPTQTHPQRDTSIENDLVPNLTFPVRGIDYPWFLISASKF
jgi:hypothetical protein